jgi:uncharacterized protein HemY
MGNQDRIDQFEALLAQNAQSELLHFSLGNEYFKAGRFEDAAGSFRTTIRLKSEYTAAYRQLGKTLEKTGDAAGARQAYLDGITVGEQTGDLQVIKEMQVFLKRLDKAKGN